MLAYSFSKLKGKSKYSFLVSDSDGADHTLQTLEFFRAMLKHQRSYCDVSLLLPQLLKVKPQALSMEVVNVVSSILSLLKTQRRAVAQADVILAVLVGLLHSRGCSTQQR